MRKIRNWFKGGRDTDRRAGQSRRYRFQGRWWAQRPVDTEQFSLAAQMIHDLMRDQGDDRTLGAVMERLVQTNAIGGLLAILLMPEEQAQFDAAGARARVGMFKRFPAEDAWGVVRDFFTLNRNMSGLIAQYLGALAGRKN